MAQDDDTYRGLMAFAGQVGGADTPPEETARGRGWLDEAGNVTEEGRRALQEIEGQSGTRSVFR